MAEDKNKKNIKEKKSKTKKQVNPKTPTAQKEDLENVVKKADAVILISVTRGNIEIRSLKNVNYSYEAKGILLGAIHSYLVRPISSTLQKINQSNVHMHQNTIQELKKLIQPEDETEEDVENEEQKEE